MRFMEKYRHFVWDFDGMLFDSYPHTARALYKTLRDAGREEPEEGLWNLRPERMDGMTGEK